MTTTTTRKKSAAADDQPSLLGGTQTPAAAPAPPTPAATTAPLAAPPAAVSVGGPGSGASAGTTPETERGLAGSTAASPNGEGPQQGNSQNGNGQALAPVRPEALKVAVADEDNPWDLSAEELAEVLGADGLGDASAEDFRIGYWVFNVLNREVELEDGSKIKTRRDQWWNTLTNRVADVIEGVFVGFRKTHSFDRYSNKVNKTERFCRSDDRVTGTALADFNYKATDAKGAEITVAVKQGQQRPCANCPQQEWRTIKDPETGETRPKKDCGLVRNLVFYETGSASPEPGVVRFKRSSARAIVDMLSRHFLGKWKVSVPKRDPRTRKLLAGPDGKPVMVPRLVNYPLYSFVFSISLVVDKSGNYAVPEFKKVRQCNHDEIMYWASQAQFIAEMSQRVIEEADKAENAAGVGAEDEAQGGGRADDPDAGGAPAADEAFDASRIPADGGTKIDGDESF